MKKRILSIMLASAMFISSFTPADVYAAQTADEDQTVYSGLVDEEIEIGELAEETAVPGSHIIKEVYSDTGFYIITDDGQNGISYGDGVISDDAPDVEYTDDQAVIYQRMIAMMDKYPEGMKWTNSNTYTWYNVYVDEDFPYPYTMGGGGCAAFCMILSDAAFGTTALVYKRSNVVYDDLKVGDILRINNDTHSVIILEKNSDGVVIAEGNYNSSIHWGRKLTRAQVEAADFYETRYAVRYTCSFNSNGGSSVASVSVNQNSLVTKPEDPVRQGYRFDGWYKDSALSKAWNFAGDTVQSDITLYAKWTKIYTCTFDTRGGSSVSPSYANSEGYVLLPASPVRTKYVFKGWYQDPDCTTPAYLYEDYDDNLYVKISNDTTLYAKWAIDESLLLQTISLDKTNITLTPGETTVIYATLSPADSAASLDWSTDSECISIMKSYDGKSATVTAVDKGKALITVTAVETTEGNTVTRTAYSDIRVKSSGAGTVTSATLVAGEQVNIKEAFFGDDEDLTFKVSPATYASVNKQGVMSVKKAGNVTIQAIDSEGEEYESIDVTILPKPVIRLARPLTYTGQTVSIYDCITNALDAGEYTFIRFTSSKENVAKIDDDGLITAVAQGTTSITAYIAEKGSNGAQKTVTAKVPVSVKLPSFAKENYKIQTGQKLTLAMKNVNAVTGVVYESLDESLLKVEPQTNKKGQPTGKMIITAIAADPEDEAVEIRAEIDEQIYTCSVNIVRPTISAETLIVKPGKQKTISIKNTKIKKSEIVWESDDPNVAVVSAGGKIKGVGTGTTTIFAEVGGIRCECVVTVE